MLQIIWGISSFSAVLSSCIKRKESVAILLILMMICYVLSFIRWETGTDWDTYISIFRASNNLSDNYTNVEYLFFLLNHICRRISSSYSFALFIEATIIFLCTFSILKQQPYPLISFFLLFSGTMGNIMFVRQSIAVSIVLFSYIFILNKKKKGFIICILVATLVHTSSIMALPIYWIYYSNIKWKYVITLLVFVLIIGIYSSGVWLRDISVIHPFIEYKINNYLNASESNADLAYITMSPQEAIFKHLLKRSLALILILLFCRSSVIKDLRLKGYLMIYIYSSLLYLLVTPLSMNLSRICTPLEIVDIFLYPYIYTQVKHRANKYFILICILLLGLSKFMSNFNRFPEIFNNYITIFE